MQFLNGNTKGEFYRGKRKRVGPAIIITVIAIIVVVFLVMTFYGLQKYIVVTNDGIKLDIPFINGGASFMAQGDDGNITVEYEKVDAELVIGEADYSNVAASAGEGLEAIKAGFISAGNIGEASAKSYAENLGDKNAVVLELKPNSGKLAWKTSVEFADAYGLNGTAELAPVITALKEKSIYVIAYMSCLVDNSLSEHYSQMILKTADGDDCTDGSGTWLDPYSSDLKSYIIALCRELSDMGVDEIILKNIQLPSADTVTYVFNASTTAEPTPQSAVSGFALDVTRALKSCSAKISVRCDSETALSTGEDPATGQNAALFFKVFDRVYCVTDAARANDLCSGVGNLIEIGTADTRFVPMYSGEGTNSGSRVILD